MLIGLTARNAAGKDEVARYLVGHHGYRYFSLSDVLRGELERKRVPVSRENLTAEGNALRGARGAGALARIALEALEGIDKAVVVSIRNPGEVEVLRERKDFILVGVDAPVEVRYRRAAARGRSDDARSLEDFIRQERAELSGGENEQQLERVFGMSDRVISNEGTLEDLYAKVEELL